MRLFLANLIHYVKFTRIIKRYLHYAVQRLLEQFSAVVILGPRQVGKTTLAKSICDESYKNAIYLDLELPSDLTKLKEPELYFRNHVNQLIIIDEIQRFPHLFQTLRGIIDINRQKGKKSGQFLLLGSASNTLLQQTSESLAGRIIYTELSGFNLQELSNKEVDNLWFRGGFPESFLASSDKHSLLWRLSFTKTYLERDIPQIGPKISSEILRKFWTMLAYNQGDLFNASKMAANLGVSVPTIIRYLHLLSDLFLVRILQPWANNGKKRLVKTPKVYIRDGCIAHALLGLESFEKLLEHLISGGSWENFIIENILNSISSSLNAHFTYWFYRTAAGAEIDLVLEKDFNTRIVIKIKRSLSPFLTKGFYKAYEDLQPQKAYVVYPGAERYPLTENVEAISIIDLIKELDVIL